MHGAEALNTVATALTVLANVALLALLAVGLAALFGGRMRRLASGLVGWVGPRALLMALVVAAVATAGSLCYSEILGFVPCLLCWDQRICMYPLVALFAVGVARRDAGVVWYATPLVIVGIGTALNHWLIERASSLPLGSASSGALCSVPYFEKLGYVTLAFMDLSAFLLIASLLVVAVVHDRTLPAGRASSRLLL